MGKKLLRSAILAASLAFGSYSHAADTAPKNIGDALNILVGAYNGAAKAAAENNGTAVQSIDRNDLKPLEETLTRYQNELQGMVKDDGELDTQKLGRFLNRLQSENQGDISYDFAQALSVLNGLSISENPQQLLDQHLISELVGAAKSETLKQELSEAAPYLGAVLQFGELLSSSTEKGDSAALTNNALQKLVEQQRTESGVVKDMALITTRLKLLYADQALGKRPTDREITSLNKALSRLEKQVIAGGSDVITQDMYAELLRPLSALGKPFAKQYMHWEELRALSLHQQTKDRKVQEFDPATRQLLDALNYDQLPAKVQRELLERMNITTPD